MDVNVIIFTMAFMDIGRLLVIDDGSVYHD